MKKIFVFLAIGMVLLLASGVFALTTELSSELQGFVQSLAEKKGIASGDIVSISEVDFNSLPDEIKLENIDDTSLSLYQIDLGDGTPVYVITLSDKTFQKTLETVDLKRSYLNFGFEGFSTGSRFLETATGVETSLEKGYIMIRRGSITGISTNLEVSKGIELGQIEIIIYKNGEVLGFGNTLSTFSSGIKSDYDVQSEETITFESGDIISVYLKTDNWISWSDVITMIEITTLD